MLWKPPASKHYNSQICCSHLICHIPVNRAKNKKSRDYEASFFPSQSFSLRQASRQGQKLQVARQNRLWQAAQESEPFGERNRGISVEV